jgi:hypothetical protein
MRPHRIGTWALSLLVAVGMLGMPGGAWGQALLDLLSRGQVQAVAPSPTPRTFGTGRAEGVGPVGVRSKLGAGGHMVISHREGKDPAFLEEGAYVRFHLLRDHRERGPILLPECAHHGGCSSGNGSHEQVR